MGNKFYKDNLSFSLLLRKCQERGITLAPLMTMNNHGSCVMPYEDWRDNPKGGFVKRIVIKNPCRKCAPCLRLRRKKWTHRANFELNAHLKAWFVTLTFHPVEMQKIIAEGSLFSTFEKHSPDVKSKTEFQGFTKAAGIRLTKYFKRLRKRGHEIRYIFVTEKHKSGLPHLHGLIYGNITKRELEGSWNYGFTSIKLVRDEKAIRYVTKYLAKDAESRVRASLKFGQRTLPNSRPQAISET